MKKFTHGIMAVDPLNIDENDEVAVVHFIGLWKEPTEAEFLKYKNEILTTPEYGLVDIADRIVVLPAPEDIVEKYYNLSNEHEISKLN
jgi:hypothetical protein